MLKPATPQSGVAVSQAGRPGNRVMTLKIPSVVE